MSLPPQLVVFSDLDGTLLDHDTYSWEAARPAVRDLKRYAIPLVLVTSKTRAEVVALRAALGNDHPYVVENGAATVIPPGYFADAGDADGGETVFTEGPPRESLLELLTRVRENGGYRFRGFSELGEVGIATLTGLDPGAARAANRRIASEPLEWLDTGAQLVRFADRLAGEGLRCVRGGRFVHVMGNFDKADAMARLLECYARRYPRSELISMALGDGPNDLKMLAAADIAVVVVGKHDHAMPDPRAPRVIRTTSPGPTGWRDAVQQIVGEYTTVA